MRSVALGLSIAAIAVGLVGVALFTPPGQAVGMQAGPRCWVGLTGHEVALEVAGWLPWAGCQTFLDGIPGTYERDPTDAPLMCRRDFAGLRYRVRDRGIANIYGRAWCQEIQRWQ